MNNKQKEKRAWHRPVPGFVDLEGHVYWFESYNERQYALQLLFDANVKAFRTQPFSLVHENAQGQPVRVDDDSVCRFKPPK